MAPPAKPKLPVWFRAVGFGDAHTLSAERTPACRDPKAWATEMENLFAQVHSFARQARADLIFTPGDLFHVKASTAHADVLRFIRAARPLVDEFGPICVTTGNHDMVGHNLKDSQHRQPIQVLAEAGIVRRVDIEPFVLQKDGRVLWVAGVSYGKHAVGLLFNNTVHACLVLTHHDVGKGRAMNAQNAMAPYLKVGIPLAVVNGHVHDETFVADFPKGKAFANVGVFGRVSAAERDVTPKYSLVSFTKDTATIRLMDFDAPGPDSFTDTSEDPVLAASDEKMLTAFIAELNRADDQVADADLAELLRSFGLKRPGGQPATEAALAILSDVRASRR